MTAELSAEQAALRARFRAFTERHVQPHASKADADGRLPDEVVTELGRAGLLAAMVPEAFGGTPLDSVSYGLLHEELGRVCSSTRSLVTVHTMVCAAITRWGVPELRRTWLPKLAAGECVASFALSEPNAGSDAAGIETNVVRSAGGYQIDGTKKWISFGQIAGLFLVFGRLAEGAVAIVVPRDTAGLSVRPIGGLLGCRASMLAEVVFEGCRVPESNVLARPGFGISHVAQSALDVGRLSIAWGSLGLHRACLEASVGYVRERKQFGVPIAEHALVRRLITNMYAEFTASRLICLEAARQREKSAIDALTSVMLAKYYASTAAMRAASDAVQLHGANGCQVEFGVERFFRDAKVAEIIEGSSQIQQLVIGKHVAQALDLDLKVGTSL